MARGNKQNGRWQGAISQMADGRWQEAISKIANGKGLLAKNSQREGSLQVYFLPIC